MAPHRWLTGYCLSPTVRPPAAGAAAPGRSRARTSSRREPALAGEPDRRVAVGQRGEVVAEPAVDAQQVGPDAGRGLARALRAEVVVADWSARRGRRRAPRRGRRGGSRPPATRTEVKPSRSRGTPEVGQEHLDAEDVDRALRGDGEAAAGGAGAGAGAAVGAEQPVGVLVGDLLEVGLSAGSPSRTLSDGVVGDAFDDVGRSAWRPAAPRPGRRAARRRCAGAPSKASTRASSATRCCDAVGGRAGSSWNRKPDQQQGGAGAARRRCASRRRGGPVARRPGRRGRGRSPGRSGRAPGRSGRCGRGPPRRGRPAARAWNGSGSRSPTGRLLRTPSGRVARTAVNPSSVGGDGASRARAGCAVRNVSRSPCGAEGGADLVDLGGDLLGLDGVLGVPGAGGLLLLGRRRSRPRRARRRCSSRPRSRVAGRGRRRRAAAGLRRGRR